MYLADYQPSREDEEREMRRIRDRALKRLRELTGRRDSTAQAPEELMPGVWSVLARQRAKRRGARIA